MIGAIGSPRPQRATMVTPGSVSAIREIACPSRPEAPTNKTRTAVPMSDAALECFKRAPKARLRFAAHFAERQAHFSRHRSAPRKRGFYRHRIRLNEEVLKQTPKMPVHSASGLVITSGKSA